MLITLLLNVILNVHSSPPLSFSYKSLFSFSFIYIRLYLKNYNSSLQKLKY